MLARLQLATGDPARQYGSALYRDTGFTSGPSVSLGNATVVELRRQETDRVSERPVATIYIKILQETTVSSVSDRIARP